MKTSDIYLICFSVGLLGLGSRAFGAPIQVPEVRKPLADNACAMLVEKAKEGARRLANTPDLVDMCSHSVENCGKAKTEMMNTLAFKTDGKLLVCKNG